MNVRGARKDRQPACLRPVGGVPAPHREAWPWPSCHRDGPGEMRAAPRVPASRCGLEDPRRVTRPALVHSPADLLATAVRFTLRAAEDYVPCSLAQRRAARTLAKAFPAPSGAQ